jgi:hypothetical protein
MADPDVEAARAMLAFNGRMNDISVSLQSSSHQGMGGSGIQNETGGDNRPGARPPLSNRSDSETLKRFLRECHVGPSTIAAIPDSFGLGMFISLSREDINELSQEVGTQMLLRTTQTLVRNELTSQLIARPAEPIALLEERPNQRVSAPQHHPVNPVQELGAAARDNVDAYLVSQSVNTPTGRDCIYKLYGQQEGGVATELARLPSTTRGSCAPKGLVAITIPDLGVNLVTNVADQRALRVQYWHSYLMIGLHYHFTAMGLEPWGVNTAYFMSTIFRGLSLEVYNRTPSQVSCQNMFKFQEAPAF